MPVPGLHRRCRYPAPRRPSSSSRRRCRSSASAVERASRPEAPLGTRTARAGLLGRGASSSHAGEPSPTAVRVLLADPPAFTPPYDHALASALARAGAEVELVTSRFRFGEAPEPDGYVAQRALLPALVAPLPAQPAAPAAEGGRAPVRGRAPRARDCDVVHVQWLAAARARRAPPALAPPVGVHRARHPAAPHGRQAGALARASGAASTGSSSTASAAARRWPSRDRRARDRPPGVPERPAAARTTAARCSSSA